MISFRTVFKISKIHIITVFMTFLGVIGLIRDYLANGLSFVAQQLMDVYDLILSVVTFPLVEVLNLIVEYVRIDLNISPLWSYSFSLLMLKVGLDVRIDLKERRNFFAFFEFSLGFGLSFSFGILGGILYFSHEIWLLLCCVASLTLYEVLRGLISANFYQFSDQTYLQRYKYRLRHFALPQAICGFIAVQVYALLLVFGFSGTGAFSLVAYIFLVGLFSILDAALVALKEPSEKILPVFSRLNRREFGLGILYGYALVLIELLF